MRVITKFIFPVLIIGLILAGCGGVSETKPISEVKAEAKTMSVDRLKSTVEKYQKAIDARRTDMKKLTDRLRAIPIKDLMGDEAKKIKEDIESLNKSVRALAERLRIYSAELRDKA